MAINKVLYSSENEVWETPQDLFNRLNDEFHFDIDVCATSENAKCSKFFSPLDDGLAQDWQYSDSEYIGDTNVDMNEWYEEL